MGYMPTDQKLTLHKSYEAKFLNVNEAERNSEQSSTYPGIIRFTFSRDRFMDMRPASSNLLSFDCRIVSWLIRKIGRHDERIQCNEIELN